MSDESRQIVRAVTRVSVRRVPPIDYVRDTRGAWLPIEFLMPDELLDLLGVVAYHKPPRASRRPSPAPRVKRRYP